MRICVVCSGSISLAKQLFVYIVNIAQGDFGDSYVSRAPVFEVIFARLPATLLLTVSQYVLAVVGGIMLGVLSLHNGREAWSIPA